MVVVGDEWADRWRRYLSTWWAAVSGGRFYTRWSLGASFVTAGMLSVPTIGAPTPENYGKAVVVSVAGWAILAVALLPVVVAERTLRSRGLRGGLVIASVLAVGLVRATLNDELSMAIWDEPTVGEVGPRMATNLLTAIAVLSLVGMTTTQHRRAWETAQRLTHARASMRASLEQAQSLDADLRRLIDDAVAQLCAERERLLSGTVDFDAVRGYSDEVRAVSHRLNTLASADVGRPTAVAETPMRRIPLLRRLVPTPRLWVGGVFAMVCIPFIFTEAGLVITVGALVVILLGDLAAGEVLRRFLRRRRRSPSARSRMFFAVWASAGIWLAAAGVILLPGIGVLALLPIPSILTAAVSVSVGIEASRRARTDEREATVALAEIVQTLAARTARTRAPLRSAAEILHGRVQGSCVILAAQADEHPPSDDEIAAFRRRTDEAFDAISASGAEVQELGEGLESLLEAWQTVIAVEAGVDAEAEQAMADPFVGPLVVVVVNEGLVNAVKHAAARTATVRIDARDEGGVRVQVASRGRLPAVPPRGGIGSKMPNARLFQRGAEVVLEVELAREAQLGR